VVARWWSARSGTLGRPDGVLAWLRRPGWGGAGQTGADAGLDGARALLVAADRYDRRSSTAARRRVPGAILDNEVQRYGSRTVVVAGPWARERDIVNPSYLAPRNFDDLRTATRDDRWAAVVEGSTAVLRDLMRDGSLPPDWAQMQPDGSAVATAAPDATGAEPGYGLDAPRTFLRLAESCDDELRGLAAAAAPSAIERAEDATHPVTIVGAAAAARASGDADRADVLLDRAEAMAERHPSYYGWALVALGRIVLQSDALGVCP
jgi:endoglucanase